MRAFPCRHRQPLFGWSVAMVCIAASAALSAESLIVRSPNAIARRFLGADAVTVATIDRVSAWLSRNDRAELLARQRSFAQSRAFAAIEVYPVRIGTRCDGATAHQIARQLCDARIGRCCGIAATVVFTTTIPNAHDPDGVWGLARAFSAHLRSRPSEADYALYAAYALGDRWEATKVQLVLCTARGEWVIADCLDATSADFQELKPVTPAACTELLIRRLRAYCAAGSAEATSAHTPRPAPPEAVTTFLSQP